MTFQNLASNNMTKLKFQSVEKTDQTKSLKSIF